MAQSIGAKMPTINQANNPRCPDQHQRRPHLRFARNLYTDYDPWAASGQQTSADIAVVVL